MSKLRNNLDSLKRNYTSLKYSGDLADDVGLVDARPVFGRIGPVLAMAAAVAVAATVWVMMPDSEPTNRQNAVEVVAPDTSIAPPEQVASPKPQQPVHADWLAGLSWTETGTISPPTWDDVSTVSESISVSMPYQSLSMPSLLEIDTAITESNEDVVSALPQEEGA